MNNTSWSPSDYAAWGALTLSLSYGVVAAMNSLRGADIIFSGPELVEFRCEPWNRKAGQCAEDALLTITGSSMTYTNTGAETYHGTLEDESVSFEFDGRPVTLDWYYFSNITNVGSQKSVAGQLIITGAATTRSETQFFPRWKICEGNISQCDNGLSDKNFVLWTDALEHVSSESKLPSLDLAFDVTFKEDRFSTKTSQHKCTVIFPKRIRDRAEKGNKVRYFNVPCIP